MRKRWRSLIIWKNEEEDFWSRLLKPAPVGVRSRAHVQYGLSFQVRVESNFCNFSLSEHNLCTFSLSIPSLQLLSQHIIFATTSLSTIYATSSLWTQSMHLHSANLFGNCLKSGPSLLNNLGFQSEKWGWSCVPELQSIATIQAHWLIVGALHCIALLCLL